MKEEVVAHTVSRCPYLHGTGCTIILQIALVAMDECLQ